MDHDDDMIDCPQCLGSGFIYDGDDDEPCPTCLGDGAIEPGAEVCGDPAEMSDTPHGIDDDGERGDCDMEPGSYEDDGRFDE